MAKNFLAWGPPGGRYGPDPVFRPQNRAKSFFGPADHIHFRAKIFFIPLSMSGKVLEGEKKNFCNRPKIGDFWPKFGDFGALFKKFKNNVPTVQFLRFFVKSQLKGATFRESMKERLDF